jgi:hypothetical protein
MPGEEFHPDNKSDDQGAQQQHVTDGPDLNALREAASNEGFSSEGSGHMNEPVTEVGGEVLEHAGVDVPENTEHGDENEIGNVEQLEKELEAAREKWQQSIETMDKLREAANITAWLARLYADNFPDKTGDATTMRFSVGDFIGPLVNKNSQEIPHAAGEVRRLEEELEKARSASEN